MPDTPSRNIYFELTEAFNAAEPTVALASVQAVVYYRVAIMSKDGDWVIREAPGACSMVLRELEARGARYRPGAPLDVRWLAGGWSSHFEFFDARQRRVRCDFLSRPPRVSQGAIDRLFVRAERSAKLNVVDLDTLIAMKQTQRAKDYAVIGELATKLSPEREIELTTDPDRILALAPMYGRSSARPAVRAAATSSNRHAVVVALAEETDNLQQAYRRRVAAYEAAARPYVQECRVTGVAALPVREAHARMLDIAERLLPRSVDPGFATQMLSEDDVNLRELSAEELDAAWDLWFDLAQVTNESDPPYSHGVFVNQVAAPPLKS